MDQRLGGSDVNSTELANNFLAVISTFSFSDCNKYVMYDYVALFSWGMFFRLVSFLVLRFAKTSSY